MDIKKEAVKKINFNRKLLFYLNIPLIISIPLMLEGGFLLDEIHTKNVDMTYMIL
jgi:hypothetical protein